MQSPAVALVKLARYRGDRVILAPGQTEPQRTNGRDLWIAALVGLAAAAAYATLGQTTLHHNDGHRILELIGTGELDFGRHHLSTPAMYAFHHLVGAPLGLLPFRSVTLLNGLSSAVAVALLYTSARTLGLPRGSALGAAALFGGCFPVLFFATLVEFHGVFLPWITLSFWLACRWLRTGHVAWALSMGAVAGLATQLHSMGIFASGLFSAWLWTARPDVPARRRLAQAAAAIAGPIDLLVANAGTMTARGGRRASSTIWQPRSPGRPLSRGPRAAGMVPPPYTRSAWSSHGRSSRGERSTRRTCATG